MALFEGTQEAAGHVQEAGTELADSLGVWGTYGAYFLGVLAALVGIGKGGQFVANQASKFLNGGKKAQEA